MTFELPKLPYEKTELEPYISAETIDFHYGKHHQTYVNKLNELAKGTEFEKLSLEDVIRKSFGVNAPIFNNAAQIWNHTFYWNSLKPNGGGEPKDKVLSAKINDSFGSYENFIAKFSDAAVTQFGSGWAWLVLNVKTGKMEILKTPNAETPLTNPDYRPLLTIDVWEHAYYIDYRNQRPKYITDFVSKLINWDFVSKNLK